MAEQIPAAKFVELPGDDHIPWIGNADALLAEIQEFLTGKPPVLEADRVLATVLFIDIVQSTQRATAIGDSRWRDLVSNYQQQVGKEVAHFGGRVVNTAGDGVFAIFDGPARAIKCARALRDAVGRLGLAIRCGIHTGECVIEGNDVAGVAVHIGARVAARADPGEILLSSTVKDLIAGSRVECLDRGSHVLKGVPGRWRLFAVKECGRQVLGTRRRHFPEVKEKIFNPFFTTKPAGEGTGFGLSLSHDIVVKQHAGSIEVDTRPGEFTEFKVILPRRAATSKAGADK